VLSFLNQLDEVMKLSKVMSKILLAEEKQALGGFKNIYGIVVSGKRTG
jgi:hypothetical protein